MLRKPKARGKRRRHQRKRNCDKAAAAARCDNCGGQLEKETGEREDETQSQL